jgi:hypothetical protein
MSSASRRFGAELWPARLFSDRRGPVDCAAHVARDDYHASYGSHAGHAFVGSPRAGA